ncbi:MAG: hypothetical protein IJN88_04660 [Clostridia bacterium]|nr:hypothetical protein [Clostridia bacterium]
MKKALRILSAITCACCLLYLVLLAAPVLMPDDSIGFAILFCVIVLPCASSLLWSFFILRSKELYGSLKMFSIASLIINTVLLLNTFFAFLPFGEAGIWIQIAVGIITNIIFLSKTKN